MCRTESGTFRSTREEYSLGIVFKSQSAHPRLGAVWVDLLDSLLICNGFLHGLQPACGSARKDPWLQAQIGVVRSSPGEVGFCYVRFK